MFFLHDGHHILGPYGFLDTPVGDVGQEFGYRLTVPICITANFAGWDVSTQ